MVVVLLQKVLVHNFGDLKLLHDIETTANPKGLCSVSQNADRMILVCLGLRKGQVRVVDYASNRAIYIGVHESELAWFALSDNGKRLATASSKGTLIRVFDTKDGSFLQEVTLQKTHLFCDLMLLEFRKNNYKIVETCHIESPRVSYMIPIGTL